MAVGPSRRGARLGLVLVLVLVTSVVAAEDTTTTATPATVTPPIAVPDVASRAEELTARVRAIEEGLAPDPDIEAIAGELPARAARIERALAETQQVLRQTQQLKVLQHLRDTWQARQDGLGRVSAVLARRALLLEGDLDALAALTDLWTRTRDDARARNAPEAVTDRIRASLALIQDARRRVTEERARVLALQDEVARLRTAIDDTLARVEAARRALVGRLLVPDSPPMWRLRPGDTGGGRVLSRVADDLRAQVERAVDLRSVFVPGLVFQAILLAVLVLAFRAARRLASAAPADDEVTTAAQVLDAPYSSALLLTLLTSFWLYPGLPHVAAQLISAVALLPVIRLLRPMTAPRLLPLLYAFAGFFLIDRVRDVTTAAPAVEQLLFLFEMLAAIGLMTVVVRRVPASVPWAALVPRAMILVLATAFVAAALGYMQLARIAAGSVLISTYLALALHAAVRVVSGLIAWALRARPFQRLAMVRTQRDVIQARLDTALRAAAVVAWVFVTLTALQLRAPALAALRAAWAFDVAPGELIVTVGDLVLFGLTIWAAFLLSRLFRFTLEQEVYPRVRLGRGLPYAASTLLHYVVLGVGFVVALGTLGLDINRFTVLAGAFGVGIGFGLQNVVNNFVSGLILLFERPIQVGDAIQIGEVTGQVQRIGVRSSTIRTPQGADVVVPNAALIQERVTNWTFADRLRRMDLRIGVAYGTEPERVLALLREVALANKKVLPVPSPQAVFVGFGSSALDFELWAWTARGDEFMTIRSELGVALVHALREAGIEIPYPQHDVHLRGFPGGAGS